MSDAAFDSAYPLAIRRASARFWTPVATARRAADWLTRDVPRARVLDAGAGVGKFCAVGALTTDDAVFTGVEQRRHLVDCAERMLRAMAVKRATVLHGSLADVCWTDFDGYYLYNPFAENLYSAPERLDGSVTFSRGRFDHDVALVELALAHARPGARVVTYHGFGGTVPAGYRRTRFEPHGTGWLELWVRED